MVLKNLLRRKGRTLLTILGIGIGVSAIIGLSALADGLEEGYAAVTNGSKADYVLSDAEAYDISVSTVDEQIGEELQAMSEIAEISPAMQGLVQAEGTAYFFVYSYPANSFVLDRFQVVDGVDLYSHEADQVQGKPVMMGASAAESMNKEVGDMLRIGDSAYRVVGIYETGESFEEGAALLRMEDAQILLGMSGKVNLYYIKLKDSSLGERLQNRIERLYPDLKLSTTAKLTEKNEQADSMRGMVVGISILAVTIGGLGMMNAQLMAVMERTREIGTLRAVGWRKWRVMAMILGESILVGLLGGLLGAGLGWLMITAFSGSLGAYGASARIRPALVLRGFILVFVLGVVGGMYPAYRAAMLPPVEALRYEGGSMGKRAGRLPFGGLAAQNLWRRKGRTLLTLIAVSVTVGAVMAVDTIVRGATAAMSGFFGGSEVVVRQADIADFSLSLLDERIGDRINAMSEVKQVSGTLVGFAEMEDTGWFFLLGYEPRGAAINQFHIVEGERIQTNRQMMVGRTTAEAHDIEVGETIQIGESRFRVVGIYEADVTMLEMGGVITLRDAQVYAGHPRKVQFFSIDLRDPNQAEAVAEAINTQYPEVHATVAGEFAQQLPDMQTMDVMAGGIAILATAIGGVGMMNTMLMTVLERTREVGVLRALGWRRRKILGLILSESLAIGAISAVAGIGVAFGLIALLSKLPFYGDAFKPVWEAEIFIRAAGVAISLGLVGGLYPAYRATQMQPIEALRYE